METIDQFIARGGQVQFIPPAPTPKSQWIRDYARESALHRMGGSFPDGFTPMARKKSRGG